MDKAQFVKCLGNILTNTSFGISGARYEKEPWNDTAVIDFHERAPLMVCINGDSNAQIIIDVMRALQEHIGF